MLALFNREPFSIIVNLLYICIFITNLIYDKNKSCDIVFHPWLIFDIIVLIINLIVSIPYVRDALNSTILNETTLRHYTYYLIVYIITLISHIICITAFTILSFSSKTCTLNIPVIYNYIIIYIILNAIMLGIEILFALIRVYVNKTDDIYVEI